MESIFRASDSGPAFELMLIVFLWSVATAGTAVGLFRNVIMLEIKARLDVRHANKTNSLRLAQWELTNKTLWTGEKARAIQHAERHGKPRDPLLEFEPLTTDEVRERERRVKQGMKSSLPVRIFNKLMSCNFCQCFWSAMLLMLLFGKHEFHAGALLVDSLAYAILGTLVLDTVFKTSPCPNSQTSARPGRK